MIDGNKIILNQATIKKAVQYWLNEEVLQNNETVDSVTFNTSYSTFDVQLKPVVVK